MSEGPFEGFFVSSVDFCKHVKFDNDRKDHRDRDNKTNELSGLKPFKYRADKISVQMTSAEAIVSKAAPSP